MVRTLTIVFCVSALALPLACDMRDHVELEENVAVTTPTPKVEDAAPPPTASEPPPGEINVHSTDENLGDPPVDPSLGGEPPPMGDPVTPKPDGGSGTKPPDASVPKPDAGPAPVDASAPPPVDAGSAPPSNAICTRWRADRQNRSEGAWSGATATCSKGAVASPGNENALKLVNLYRFMAGLPAVTADAAKNDPSQDCALMMHANKALSHSPPSTWKCYNEAGKTAAGKSNIGTAPGVAAVDLYMADPGNDGTLGHRRWLLSKGLGPIGLGSTSEYSCLMVIGGTGNASRPYVAWPPAGPFPSGAIKATYAPLDTTGWSIQSDSINLNSATVKVTDNGADKPVKVTALGANYGSAYAISIIPQGWTAQKGHSYAVSVGGTSQAIAYTVDVIDCD
jgi:uncharacterized protein YkwD